MTHTWYAEVLFWCSAVVVGVCFVPAINTVLPLLRTFAYNRGHRPKPGDFLYSPSLALIYSYKDAVKNVEFPVILQPTTMVGLRNAPGVTYLAPSAGQILSPYNNASYCVMCGSDLVLGELAKKCPEGCGYIYLDHDHAGLPVITFNPDGEGQG